MGTGVYFEWNAQAHTKSYKDGRPGAPGTAPNCSKGKTAQLLFLIVFKELGQRLLTGRHHWSLQATLPFRSPATQLTTQSLFLPPVIPKTFAAYNSSSSSQWVEKEWSKNDSSAV